MILSALRICTSRLLSGACGEKTGMQKKERNIARRPNAFWTREIKRLGGGFFSERRRSFISFVQSASETRGARCLNGRIILTLIIFFADAIEINCRTSDAEERGEERCDS